MDGEADAFAGLGEGDEETTSLLAELAEEAPALEPAPRALSLSTDEETNLPPGGMAASPYDIPDFAQDAKDLDTYDDAKRRYQRQQLASAETAIQTSFAQKREQLYREIKNGKSFEEERRSAATYTTRQYANRYPIHVDKKGVNPPT
ncbi:MAG TPA: hypothetical protein VGP41_06280, partial [Candidatus Lustribacter sp.]|nr:hypothetical protein [Candidatus Lustribacter sp.]